MGAVRRWYEGGGWTDLGHTPTRVSDTSFSVSGDQTAHYAANRRIRITDSSTLYGWIDSATFSSPNTTVTVTLDSGTISSSISAVSPLFTDQEAYKNDRYAFLTTGGTVSGASTFSAALTLSGTVTLSGSGTIASFNSTGIDDNATGNRVTVADTYVSLGEGS